MCSSDLAQSSMETGANGLAVSFRPTELACDVHGRRQGLGIRGAQTQIGTEQTRSVDERVTVHDTEARELGMLEPGPPAHGNHANYRG